MDLSIIYVNWNSVEFLRASIASVYKHTIKTTYEIIVVDNASPEPGVESVKDDFPEIRLIKSEKNLGFAGANNLGFRNSGGEFVLFLNPDTELTEPSLDILLEKVRTLSDAGVVGCKLLNSDLSVQLSSIQKFPTILNQALDAEYLRLRWPHCPLWEIAPLFAPEVRVMPVDVIPGACMLLRRDVFEKVGLMTEDYFMYAEDIDLNFKTKAAGYRNYYVGTTAIIHHGGRSSAKQSVSNWATIMKYRAMVKLFGRFRGPLYAFGYRFAMGTVALARLAILAVATPVGWITGRASRVREAFSKWKAVLGWALGMGALATGKR